jgi:uncharacterized protein
MPMIRETIVTTVSAAGTPHIAPIGVHVVEAGFVIAPYRPSTTLDNILATGHAVINYTDDVRIFAGCLTGRRDWPLIPTAQIKGVYLAQALGHVELTLVNTEDDSTRPRLHCSVICEATHKSFQGFNRAQHAVLEAAILASRLHRLPRDKIESELSYLTIAIDKTAGPQELQAWSWLMEKIQSHLSQSSKASA